MTCETYSCPNSPLPHGYGHFAVYGQGKGILLELRINHSILLQSSITYHVSYPIYFCDRAPHFQFFTCCFRCTPTIVHFFPSINAAFSHLYFMTISAPSIERQATWLRSFIFYHHSCYVHQAPRAISLLHQAGPSVQHPDPLYSIYRCYLRGCRYPGAAAARPPAEGPRS